MILTKMYNCGSVKVCSGISPAFTEVANSYGFPTLTIQVPGHFWNLVLTQEGLIKIDLSFIQFSRKTFYDDREGQEEIKGLLKQALHNPFSAVEIENLGRQDTEVLSRGILPRGTGLHDKFFDPIGDFEYGKKRVARILSNRDVYRKSKSHEVYKDADFGIGMDPNILDKL